MASTFLTIGRAYMAENYYVSAMPPADRLSVGKAYVRFPIRLDTANSSSDEPMLTALLNAAADASRVVTIGLAPGITIRHFISLIPHLLIQRKVFRTRIGKKSIQCFPFRIETSTDHLYLKMFLYKSADSFFA